MCDVKHVSHVSMSIFYSFLLDYSGLLRVKAKLQQSLWRQIQLLLCHFDHLIDPGFV